jgi:hypothetical protein
MAGIDLRTARTVSRFTGAFVAMGLSASPSYAIEEYGAQIPHLESVGGCDGLCHASPGGAQNSPLYLNLESAGFVWNATMANLDADGDGFSNGWELQNPSGTWASGTPYPGNVAFVSDPTLSASLPPLPVATAPTAIFHTEGAGQNGSEEFAIENVGAVPFDYTLIPSETWMAPEPSFAQALPANQQDVILLLFATGALDVGLYQGDLSIAIPGIRADRIPALPVDLTVPESDTGLAGASALLGLGLLARRHAQDISPA